MNANNMKYGDLQFTDSHTHFDFEQFDADRVEVWAACNNSGVTTAIIPGVSVSQWSKAAAICDAHNGIYYSVGLHPFWIKAFSAVENISVQQLDALREELLRAATAKKCVAIGECGLDKFIETPLHAQQQILTLHLDISSELSLPIIIHCRKAHNEMINYLQDYKKKNKLERGGVIHAFSGSIELALQYVELGFYLGIGGTITYERANKTRHAATLLPLESILLETDSPDMPLAGKQGERNSPQYIPEIAQILADIRDDSLNNIAQQTTANAKKLFSI